VTIHIVCRDCEFEALEDDPGKVAWIIATHEDETGHDVDDDRVDGSAKLVTDGGVVQGAPGPAVSDDADAIVAHGGVTTNSDLHTDPDCPNLQNAIDTRPATDSEIQSYSWCGNCVGEPERGNQDWSPYRAAVNAGSNRGDDE